MAASLAPDRLLFADGRWLRRLSRGLALVLLCPLIVFLSVVVLAATLVLVFRDGGPGAVGGPAATAGFFGAYVAVYACGVWGGLLTTSREPGLMPPARLPRAALAYRILVVAEVVTMSLGMAAWALPAPPRFLNPAWMEPVELLLSLAAGSAFILNLSGQARRIPAPPSHRRARTAALVGLAMMAAAGVARYVLGGVRRPDGHAAAQWTALPRAVQLADVAVSLASVVAVVLFLVAIWVSRRAIRRVLKQQAALPEDWRRVARASGSA